MADESASQKKLLLWPWWLRLTHWSLVVVFIADYFILDPGSALHNWLGYFIAALVVLRIVLGFSSISAYGSFAHCKLTPEAFRQHFRELKARNIPKRKGHNPLGWLMVFFFWFLVLVLAFTGFLMHEVDAFFGNQSLDLIHLLAADAMLISACIHVAAVLVLGQWGKIALIQPMITGRRNLR